MEFLTMPFFTNSHGRRFQTGIGGTYPVNDGDPQNDVEIDDDGKHYDYDNDIDKWERD